MKKVAIMQPYAFPYLGYFQLVEKVEHFVFLDNVNYFKKGFINEIIYMENLAGNLSHCPSPLRAKK